MRSKPVVIYPIERSPLFHLRGLGALSRTLKLSSPERLLALESRVMRIPDSFYKPVLRGKRDIQKPMDELSVVHRRLYGLLSRFPLPDYVMSGKRGVGYVDNAKKHLETADYVLSVDIKKFFPRTRREFIFRFFRDRLRIASDLANLLANLCCYRGIHLPLGSPISQPLAFWAYEKMFREVKLYAEARGLTMTIFVDDITLSSSVRISKDTHLGLHRILSSYKMTVNWKKVCYRSDRRAKEITGCIVAPDKTLDAPARLKDRTAVAIRRFRVRERSKTD